MSTALKMTQILTMRQCLAFQTLCGILLPLPGSSQKENRTMMGCSETWCLALQNGVSSRLVPQPWMELLPALVVLSRVPITGYRHSMPRGTRENFPESHGYLRIYSFMLHLPSL